MEQSHTQNLTRSPEGSQRAQPHGSTTTAGQSHTGKIVNITTPKQAAWVKSLLSRKARAPSCKPVWMQIVASHGTLNNPPKPEDVLAMYPEKEALSLLQLAQKHGTMNPETGRMMDPVVFWGRRDSEEVQHVSTVKSDDDRKAEAFSKPASGDCILAHLTRMAAILQLKGTKDDATQAMFILSDYTDRLVEAKALEVDVYLACEHFIETNVDGFFPTPAALLKYLGIR